MLLKILVLIGALALIGIILWWFFGKFEQAAGKAKVVDGKQEGRVVVKGGYNPQVMVFKQGQPAEVVFDMQDSTACLSHVVFEKLGVDKDLAKDPHARVKIPTDQAGEFDYACGMNMFHGKVIVK